MKGKALAGGFLNELYQYSKPPDRSAAEDVHQRRRSVLSGLSGTGAGQVEAGDLLLDTTNYVLFVNEGTKASPYWTPGGLNQAALFGVNIDFRDQVGKAIADTGAEAILAGSGLRVFGQGRQAPRAGKIVEIGLVASDSETVWFGPLGLPAPLGLSIEHIAGTLDVILYHRTAAP